MTDAAFCSRQVQGSRPDTRVRLTSLGASSVVHNLRISSLASIFLPAVPRSRSVTLSNYVEIY